VDELTGVGVQVRVIGADVAHADQVSAVLAELSAAMPPLRGIVHAAGVLDDGILLHQRWDRFARVLAPKVQGAWNLHWSTQHLPLDFFVMFSSIASVFGAAGQSSYAAGNSFLDALAHARRAYGLPALSINWGGWSRVGLAARDQVADRMRGHGMSAIAPEDGVAALEAAMHQSAAQLVVVPVDWAAYLAQLPAGRVPPVLAELSHEARCPAGDRPGGEPGGEPGVSGNGRSALLRRLDATGPDNRRRALAAYLDEQAKRALGLDPQERLDPRQPLNERGLDSLMAIEMRSRLSNAVGRTLPATVLFDYPTVEALTGYLAEEVLRLPGERREPAEPEPGEPGSEDPESGATELTPDEVEAFLAEELAAVQTLLNGDQP
jgi:acyl carrier protein/short-subunit dehydrogenase